VLVAGKVGTVESVHVFHTVLHTSDMRVVIVPNGAITAASIENLSALSTRRIELEFSVGFGHDLEGAQAALASAVADDPRVLRDPPPDITLVEFAETRVSFAIHASVKPEEIAQVTSELMERVKHELDQRLITAKAA
jgi:small conductance mechanosensitive channel